jgi:cellulose synthase/poly-beta-1,6-N-acetylglucosamine synthase-like glycosyltransferase/peptidoglycan/xylan/chitin deacetylase (PgdA/CDA1 family)
VQRQTSAAWALRSAGMSFDRVAAGSMPVVGSGVLVRIVAIVHRKGRWLAVDPFDGGYVRDVLPAELPIVREATFAVDRYGELPAGQLALTFDDGPDPTWTPKILDLLAANHIPATFFMIGEHAAAHPDLVRRVVAGGNLIGNHTLTHPNPAAVNAAQMRAEVEMTDRVIRAAGGPTTRFFRLPYDDVDVATMQGEATAIYQAQKLGYTLVSFDRDSHDWQFPTRQRRPEPVDLDGRGHVLLMHDGGGDRAQTYDYLKQTIALAHARGYTFTTPAQLVPDGTRSLHRAVASVTDSIALAATLALLVWPPHVVYLLLLFGLIEGLVLGPLYLALASYQHRRHRRLAVIRKDPDLVTVVIAAYNEDVVIRMSVSSVLASAYPNLEILVVNDGSTDQTGAILDAMAAANERIRVIHLPNGGKSEAFNLAFQQARGDIVVTMDADTLFTPDTIPTLVRHFHDPAVGAVAGFVRVGNIRGWLTAWQSLEYIMGIGVERAAHSVIGAVAVVPGACGAWRRALVLEAGGYSKDTLTEDCDLALTFQRLGHHIVQDSSAVAYTEAPQSVRALLRQRFRWTFGNLQSFWKHRAMMFRPRHGILGLILMPYATLSLLLSVVLVPIRLGSALAILLGFQHVHLVLAVNAAFVGAQIIQAMIGVRMARASLWHLLIVPFYWIIDEPLRAGVAAMALYAAVRGRIHGWNKLQRLGSATAGTDICTTTTDHGAWIEAQSSIR